MTTDTLTLPTISDKVHRQFERLTMLGELTRMTIESLPHSTDSDVPVALLNGMKEMLGTDTAEMWRLFESIEAMTSEVAHA